MAEFRRHKAINFDLDSHALRSRFGEKGRTAAYAAIRSFLAKRGFEHRQGSGYRSTSTLSELDVADLIVELYEELEWLPACVRKLDVTNIGTAYDLDTIAKRRIANKHRKQDEFFDVEL